MHIRHVQANIKMFIHHSLCKGIRLYAVNSHLRHSRTHNASLLKRAFGHRLDILQNEQFMSKYYDNFPVPKESELDTTEFRTRLETW